LSAGPHNLVRRLCNFGARAGRRCCRSLARPAPAGGGDRSRGGDAGGAAAAATAPGPLCQWTRRAFGVRQRISLAHCRPRLTAVGLRLVGTMLDDRIKEGPLGEWTGYYASGSDLEPAIRIDTLMYSDDPILVGAIPAVPPNDNTFYFGSYRCGAVWNQLEAAGIPSVQGVWTHEAGGSRFML